VFGATQVRDLDAVRQRARERGAAAENLVATELEAGGWTLLARNWRGGGGELDIVARRQDALRFVEVKERGPDDLVGLEAIDANKQRHLVRAARAWLAGYDEPFDEVCFLVILVEPSESGWNLTWIDNAFDA
jgi:putative endonuclease